MQRWKTFPITNENKTIRKFGWRNWRRKKFHVTKREGRGGKARKKIVEKFLNLTINNLKEIEAFNLTKY